MSEVLQRTLRVLGTWTEAAAGGGAGPGWSAPTPGSPHSLPGGLAACLRQLTECCRVEEEELCRRQIELCESQLSKPGLSPALAAEAIVRGMFVHLMGHPTTPLHMHAVKLAQSSALLHRKLGYLACSIFLPTASEFRILLTNSILRELESKHVPSIITGLIAACNIITESSLVSLLQDRLLRLTGHENHIVRKKALVALDRFCQIAPHLWSEVAHVVLAKLSDEDPGVVAVAVQLLALRLPQEVAAGGNSVGELALLPLLHIQDQIRDKKLPKDFLYCGLMAPWLRMDILRILRRFNTILTSSSPLLPRVRQLVEECLEDDDLLKTTIGQALVYEAVLTLAHLTSLHQGHLLSAALNHISKLLQQRPHHVKYAGLCLLEAVFSSTSPPRLSPPQETCLRLCLEHQEPAIQRKSLSLVTLLATRTNVRTVVDTVLNYLRRTDKKEPAILEQVYSLMERLSDDLDWKASTLLRLIQNSDGSTRERMVEHLKLLLSPLHTTTTTTTTTNTSTEEGEDLATELELNRVRSKTSKLLNNLVDKGVKHPIIRSLLVWCEAEFSTDLAQSTQKILIVGQSSEPEVVVAAVNSLETLALRLGTLSEEGQQFLEKCSKSENADIRNAAQQAVLLLQACDKILPLAVDQQMDFTLSFLDAYVTSDLLAGGRPYIPRSCRVASSQPAPTAPQEKPWILAPYHRLQRTNQQASRTGSISSSTTTTTSSTSEQQMIRPVWTLEGRRKEGDEEDEPTRMEDSFEAVVPAAVEQRTEPSLEDVLSQGW